LRQHKQAEAVFCKEFRAAEAARTQNLRMNNLMFNSRALRFLVMLILPAASAWAQPPRRVEVYAHRGVRAFAPENVLAAYQTALRIGANWIDMDVVLSKAL
jgi:glycerophosphoryl diester phosphodiesterase